MGTITRLLRHPVKTASKLNRKNISFTLGLVRTHGFRAAMSEISDYFSRFDETGWPPCEDIECSSDRTTVLFIESTVPRFDDNAGHRTVYDYMRTLASAGYDVILMPADFCYDARYVPAYASLGIRTLYGGTFRAGWKDWILENRSRVDNIMIFRPECAETFLVFIKENTSSKVFYNVADLHYLRLEREYAVTGRKKLLRESEKMKKKELSFIEMADVTVTVSSYEQKVVSDTVPGSTVRIFPIFCYDGDAPERRKDSGHNIMFIGSFTHRPNVDAVEWFAKDILPRVMEKVPDVKLHVIGSKAPSNVLALSSDNIVLEGRLSDEELEAHYLGCSACVIPLRFGAGVKGKTVEALRYGIPLVSTSTGLEGLPEVGEVVKSFDDAESFSNELSRILTNKRDPASEKARREYVERYYSQKSLLGLFEEEFGPAVGETAH